MHELAVTQSLLDLVLEHTARAGGGRVSGVHVVSGEICGFVDDSVRFYWETLSEGTPAAGARLLFRRVPLEFECLACGSRFAPAGGGFQLEAIDIEDPAGGRPPDRGTGREER
jgi:hydrogenase nickel incorporation protein HypA/HybF